MRLELYICELCKRASNEKRSLSGQVTIEYPKALLDNGKPSMDTVYAGVCDSCVSEIHTFVLSRVKELGPTIDISSIPTSNANS